MTSSISTSSLNLSVKKWTTTWQKKNSKKLSRNSTLTRMTNLDSKSSKRHWNATAKKCLTKNWESYSKKQTTTKMVRSGLMTLLEWWCLVDLKINQLVFFQVNKNSWLLHTWYFGYVSKQDVILFLLVCNLFSFLNNLIQSPIFSFSWRLQAELCR